MALLDIQGLTVTYPTRHGVFTAVDTANVTINPGEIVGIVGESGAGKSTIGNAIMGLLEPPGQISAGTIELQGKRIDALDRDAMQALRGRAVSIIMQDPLTALNPLYTIEHQLVETIEHHRTAGGTSAQNRAVELLDAVGIPDPEIRIKHYPHQFSGGMRQRVVIALALSTEPSLIIADEPTTALDVSIQAQILELIKKLARERDVGVMLITHDMGVIAETTDKVVVMKDGKIVEQGPTTQVLGSPDHPYSRSLIASVPRADARLHRFPNLQGEGDASSKLPTIDVSTHWLGQSGNQNLQGSGEPVIAVRDLLMEFQTVSSFFKSKRRFMTAVDHVSFDIKPGEVFGIVGESGSGKSTVAKIIAGLLTPSGGSVLLDGQDLKAPASSEVRNQQRQAIQMVFQDPYSSLNPRMRVDDIVAEPIRLHNLTASAAETSRIVTELLGLVGLPPEAGKRYPHAFSGGQRQRISIARALATRPRFLICDEPTSALDVSIQAQVLNLLKDLQETLDLTLLFISHDLPVMRQMCDRIGVMYHGEMVELADTDSLFNRPQHPHTQELMALMPKLDMLSRDGIEIAA
ncbi:MAG: ABC transporter ATP-binding protein [Pseudomonadota bacterium]